MLFILQRIMLCQKTSSKGSVVESIPLSLKSQPQEGKRRQALHPFSGKAKRTIQAITDCSAWLTSLGRPWRSWSGFSGGLPSRSWGWSTCPLRRG